MSDKPNAGSVQEWYALAVSKFREAGFEPPAWDDLDRRETRAWMFAFASQLESTMRMVDAMELTFPDLYTRLEPADTSAEDPSA